MLQHNKIQAKQNPYFWGGLFFGMAVFVMTGSLSPAQAEGNPNAHQIISASAPSEEPGFQALDRALTALRTRERDVVFSILTSDRQRVYGGTAAAFMTFLRLHQHALYDHTSYHLISSTHLGTGEVLYKLSLQSYGRDESLALVKMVQDRNNIWRIKSLAILVGDSEQEI